MRSQPIILDQTEWTLRFVNSLIEFTLTSTYERMQVATPFPSQHKSSNSRAFDCRSKSNQVRGRDARGRQAATPSSARRRVTCDPPFFLLAQSDTGSVLFFLYEARLEARWSTVAAAHTT